MENAAFSQQLEGQPSREARTSSTGSADKLSTVEESLSSQPDFLPLGAGEVGGGGREGATEHQAQKADLLGGYPPSFSKHKRLLSGESTSTCIPWRTKVYSCDPTGLHEEIEDLYEYSKPRPSEYLMRSAVIANVTSIILSKWPQARVEVFGSYCTGLFLPTSDIDLVVFGNWMKLPLFSLEEEFKKADIAINGSILVLDKTSVPIIKFIDKMTEVKVDISFNQEGGLVCVRLIQTFVQQYPMLPKLIAVLKQFLTQRQLNEVYYGGISSYSLFLLLLSFLQLHPRNGATDTTANLGVLLIEFFELYGRNFNYNKTGISVLDGGSYFSKDDLQLSNPELADNNALLFIWDPVSPQENASKGCYGMWQVKTAFEQAYLRLHSLVISRELVAERRESLLSSIIHVSREVDEYRNWVERTWQVPSSASATPPYYYPMLPPLHPSVPVYLQSPLPPLHYVVGHEATSPYALPPSCQSSPATTGLGSVDSSTAS